MEEEEDENSHTFTVWLCSRLTAWILQLKKGRKVYSQINSRLFSCFVLRFYFIFLIHLAEVSLRKTLNTCHHPDCVQTVAVMMQLTTNDIIIILT